MIDLDLIKYWRDLGGSQLRRGLREEGEDVLNDLEGKRRDAAALARVKDLTWWFSWVHHSDTVWDTFRFSHVKQKFWQDRTHLIHQPTLPQSNFCYQSQPFFIWMNIWSHISHIVKGKVPLPNLMNFRKNSKRPNFWKIMFQVFMISMVTYMRGGMMAR